MFVAEGSGGAGGRGSVGQRAWHYLSLVGF